MEFSKKKIIAAVVAVILTILLFSSIEKVRPGYVGIQYNPASGINNSKMLQQGWNLSPPWTEVTKYSIATEQVFMSEDKREGSPDDDSFFVPTKDGKNVRVSVQYSYSFKEDMVKRLFIRFKGASGSEIERKFLRANVKTYMGNITSKYTILDLKSTKRNEANEELLNYLQSKFGPDGIEISAFGLIDLKADEATEKNIADIVALNQNKELAKIKKDIAKTDNEKAKAKADNDKLIAELSYQTKAGEIKAIAESEAYAMNVKQKQLSKELIEYERVLRTKGYDGITNLTILGNDSVKPVKTL